MQKILLLLILLTCSVLMSAFGQNNALVQTKTHELKQVTKLITSIEAVLTHAKQQREDLQQELKTIETAIGTTSHQLDHIDKHLKHEMLLLADLHKKEQSYLLELNAHKTILNQHLRATYMLGKHTYIKMLLNQENPYAINRLVHYYHYANAARLNIINQINQILQGLNLTQQQIIQQSQELTTLHRQQETQQGNFKLKQQQREQIIVQLNHTIENKGEKLKELLANKKALQQVLDRVNTTFFVLPFSHSPFAAMQGRLQWPTYGAIIQHFGNPIEQSELISNAIVVAAPLGQAVRAIYAGKIVFADWLRGLGLLLIIDHGHGYMSLYGHNNSLLKKVGDYIQAGDIIAKVGNSGGYEKSGLYFQIRDNGKPINPELWCKK